MLKEPNSFLSDDRLTDEDRLFVQDLNVCLERLNGSRALEIHVSEHLARSKIAWKLVTYQHVLLHRLVALVDGTALSWNHRCTLTAMLSARAFMETFAVMAELEQRVARFLADADLSGLDALAQNGIFASRDPKWLKEYPESSATNALTYVTKFDKCAPGFKRHYDTLSERCHPNSMGHNFMFGKLDRSDGSVRFEDERDPQGNAKFIIAALAVLPMVEKIMARLDEAIREVADLQHRIAPVGGKAV